MNKLLTVIVFTTLTLSASIYFLNLKTAKDNSQLENEDAPQASVEKTPEKQTVTLPEFKVLANNYHVFQTFNNCGPAALSMALSYYGISKSQQELGMILRPYQNPQGDNDDKSVTLEELAQHSKEYGLIPFHRPNGNIEIIKQFIANDIAVITRTWLKENEDIGHYRVVKGYDDTKGQLIQDDSFQNKNLWYSYEDFNKIWQKFNYEYLVLIPKDKEEIALAILKDEKDAQISWQIAVKNAQEQLSSNPQDITARFNLSVAYTNIGNHQKAVQEFEAIQDKLPFRTLWYQTEPIESYYELGNYTKVFELTSQVLNNHNRAYSELYVLRGLAYQKQGEINQSQQEFKKAIQYNNQLKNIPSSS